MTFTVDVVIPTYNRSRKLERLLKQLESLEDPVLRRIIVVDNASIDDTSEVLAAFDRVEVIRQRSNIFSAGARQAGWAVATAEFVCFIDDDNVVGDEIFTRLGSFLEFNPSVALVAPLQFRYDDGSIWCAGGVISRLVRATRSKDISLLQGEHNFDFQPNVFMLRRALKDEGFNFDWKRFPHNWSEAEVCHRIKEAGYTVRTCPSAVTYHDIDYVGVFTRLNEINAEDQARSRVVYRRLYADRVPVWIWFILVVLPVSWLLLGIEVIRQQRSWRILWRYSVGTWVGFRESLTSKVVE